MSSDPSAGVRGAVESLVGPANARRFNDDDLRHLKEAGYDTLEDLKIATHTGLANAKLKPARADLITNAQGSAAGLGAAGAVSAIDLQLDQIPEAEQASMRYVQQALNTPGVALQEQLDSVLPFVEPEERARGALQLIHSWAQAAHLAQLDDDQEPVPGSPVNALPYYA